MRIPEVQAAMRLLATRLAPEHGAELLDLARELDRRRAPKTGRTVSRRMTSEVRQEIRALREAHPEWTQQEIAAATGVNTGRVSETLKGFRK